MYHQRFKTADQRFDEKYDVLENGCWQWKTGSNRPLEHPKFACDGVYRKASHFSWARHFNSGAIPPDLYICHSCDNPRCVNPHHLFRGDHKRNMEDKAAKGRSFRGSGLVNGRAIVTPEMAATMRGLYHNEGLSQQAIASRFQVGQTTVSRIIRGDTWIGKEL